jgi:hypothetical protein
MNLLAWRPPTAAQNRSARSMFWIAAFSASVVWVPAKADPPTRMSIDAAEKMINEGDQMADRAEYMQAVELYTDAYLSIVMQIRGQQFDADVAPSLMTRTELGEEMILQMETEYTPEELKLMEASYKVFGLVPKDLNLRDTITKLLTEEVGGFYDPRTKKMVLVREDDKPEPSFFGKLFGARPAFDKDGQKVTLSHELTHALQDQLYGLLEMQRSIEKDDDMLLAFSALVEGDATLVMFGEMGRQEGDIRSMTEMEPEAAEFMFTLMKSFLPIAGGKTYRNSPRIFRDSLVFPYFQGMVFNLHLSRQGGFRNIHRAYDSPPTSSEQILHPEKYLSNRDEPQQFEFAELATAIPEDWKLLGGNCLGEFQTDILLKNIPNSIQASTGWDGDRYEVFEGPDGKLAMIWATTWDSDKDAKEFESAYRKYISLKPRTRKPKDEPTETEDTSKTDEKTEDSDDAETTVADETKSDSVPAVPTTIERYDSDVFIVRGFEESSTVEKMMSILKSAKKSEKQFPARKQPSEK